MISRLALVAALALGLSSGALAADRVTCGDGTTSAGGRGACSGHGGVRKRAKKERKETATGKAKKAATHEEARVTHPGDRRDTERLPHRTTEQRAQARTPAPPARRAERARARGEGRAPADDANPAGAIARCRDGSYSHARVHSGACSGHGGVSDWLDGSR